MTDKTSNHAKKPGSNESKINRLFNIYMSITIACITATMLLHSYWGAILAVAAMITGYKAIDCGLKTYLGTNGADLISKLPRVGILGGLLAFMMGFIFWDKDEILYFIIFALLSIINSVAVLNWEINEKAANIDSRNKPMIDGRITIGWIAGSVIVVVIGFSIISSVNGGNKSNNSYNYRSYSSGTYSSSSSKNSSNNSSSIKSNNSGKVGSSSSNSNYYHNSYNYNADPLDYDSPEDFADDAWGDFGDWDDAYDYWDDY